MLHPWARPFIPSFSLHQGVNGKPLGVFFQFKLAQVIISSEYPFDSGVNYQRALNKFEKVLCKYRYFDFLRKTE